MMIVPQLLMLTGCGATKSFTSAGNEAEERLFRNTLPNASQVPAGKTPDAVRLIAAPPKSKVIRRSPAVRTSVFGPVVVRLGWAAWLISKSMFADPSTFERSQARYRKLLLLTNSEPT